MPKFSTTTLIAFAALFAGTNVACAQDTDWTAEPSMEVNAFSAADADANGTLTLDEFQVYAASKAEAGDAAYTELVATGDYARHFAAKDTDADGYLSEDELAVTKDETLMPDPQIIDDPDMIEE